MQNSVEKKILYAIEIKWFDVEYTNKQDSFEKKIHSTNGNVRILL